MRIKENVQRAAVLSPDRVYRYTLTRRWNKTGKSVAFIGLNPSTADEHTDDPTIRRCVEFANSWGYGCVVMVNLFALRATDPKVMKAHHSPVGPDNDMYLKIVNSEYCALTIAAWGKDGTHLGRDKQVRNLIPNLHALRLSAKTGQPWHPLYLPGALKPIPWTEGGFND